MRLFNAPGHGGKQLRPGSGPGEWTLGNVDPARRRFGEEWDALIKVHIPALSAANHLLLRGYGTGRTRVGADLAGGAEFICAEAVGCSRHQRQVSGHAGETHARPEVPAYQRAVLAEFAQAGGNGRRDQKQGVR